MKKRIFYAVIGLIVALGLVFSMNYLGLISFRYFAPKYENARREVFENTQSFVESKRQAITKRYDEWRTSDAEGKAAIRMIVLQEFAHFDTSLFTPIQQGWYNKIVD